MGFGRIRTPSINFADMFPGRSWTGSGRELIEMSSSNTNDEVPIGVSTTDHRSRSSHPQSTPSCIRPPATSTTLYLQVRGRGGALAISTAFTCAPAPSTRHLACLLTPVRDARPGRQPPRRSWECVPSPLCSGDWMLGSSSYTVIAVVPPGSPASVRRAAARPDRLAQTGLVCRRAGPAMGSGQPAVHPPRDGCGEAAPQRGAVLGAGILRPAAAAARAVEAAPATGHGHDQRAHDVADLRDRLRRECRDAVFRRRGVARLRRARGPSDPRDDGGRAAATHRLPGPGARGGNLGTRSRAVLSAPTTWGVDVYRWLRVRRRHLLRTCDAGVRCSPARPVRRVRRERRAAPDASEHELLAH